MITWKQLIILNKQTSNGIWCEEDVKFENLTTSLLNFQVIDKATSTLICIQCMLISNWKYAIIDGFKKSLLLAVNILIRYNSFWLANQELVGIHNDAAHEELVEIYNWLTSRKSILQSEN